MESSKPKRATAQQPIESASHPAALLRLTTVQALTGLGRSSIYAKVRNQTFPAPLRQGSRFSRWRAADVTRWLEGVK